MQKNILLVLFLLFIFLFFSLISQSDEHYFKLMNEENMEQGLIGNKTFNVRQYDFDAEYYQ